MAVAVAPNVDPGDRSAFEAQTRPVYDPRIWSGSGWYSSIDAVVRKLGHQWYGNSVSVKNWRDISFTMGLADYSGWRWMETHTWFTPNGLLADLWLDLSSNGEFWGSTIGDPGAGNEFAWPVYGPPHPLVAYR